MKLFEKYVILFATFEGDCSKLPTNRNKIG